MTHFLSSFLSCLLVYLVQLLRLGWCELGHKGPQITEGEEGEGGEGRRVREEGEDIQQLKPLVPFHHTSSMMSSLLQTCSLQHILGCDLQSPPRPERVNGHPTLAMPIKAPPTHHPPSCSVPAPALWEGPQEG